MAVPKKPERRVQSEKASAARSGSSDAASVSTAQSAPAVLPVQESAAMAGSGSKMKEAQGQALPASGQTVPEQDLAYGAGSANAGGTHDFSGASPSMLQMSPDERARQRHGAAAQPIVLQKAGFDLKGYQLVTQRGKRIVVPFKESLNALRFARATDGRMTLAAASPSPVLALRPTDTLQNVAVPGCYWQPLLTGPFSSQPLYARPAPDWAQFVAMRWYPNMAVVGGLTSLEADDASFAWLPRSYIRIGATRLSDFIAYRAYAAAHADAFRLHAVYDSAPAPAAATPPRTATKTPGRLIGKPRP